MALTLLKKNVSIYIEDIFEPRGPPDITALRSHYSLHSHLLTDSLGYHVPTECVEAALKMRSNEQPLLCRWDPFELSPFWDLETNIFDSEYSSTESAFGSPLSSNFPLAGGSSDSGYSTSLDNDSPETTDATTSSDFLGHISVADRFKDDKEGSVDLVSLSEDDSNRECDSDSQLVGSPSSLSHESVTSREGKERHESSARQKDYGKQSKDLEDLVDGCSTSHVIQDTYQHRANSPDKTPTTIEDGDKSSSSSLTLTQSRATTPNLVPPSRAPTLFASAPSGDGSDNDSYREERTLKRKRAKSESSPDAAPTRRRPRKAPRAPPKNAKVCWESPCPHNYLLMFVFRSSLSSPVLRLGSASHARRLI